MNASLNVYSFPRFCVEMRTGLKRAALVPTENISTLYINCRYATRNVMPLSSEFSPDQAVLKVAGVTMVRIAYPTELYQNLENDFLRA